MYTCYLPFHAYMSQASGRYVEILKMQICVNCDCLCLADSEIDYRRDLYHLSESISIEDITYTGPLLWASNFPKLAKVIIMIMKHFFFKEHNLKKKGGAQSAS